MLDRMHNADKYFSVMMLTVELKWIFCTPMELLVLSKCVSCWLASAQIVDYHSYKIAQSN